MPRNLYNWSFADVNRFLKERGFQVTHIRGSHYFYLGSVNGNLKQVSVAFHGQRIIKPKTMKSIIIQSGLSKDEWLKK